MQAGNHGMPVAPPRQPDLHGPRWNATGRLQGSLAFASRRLLPALILVLVLLSGCGGGKRPKKVKLPPPVKGRLGWKEVGVASWYGHPYHGRTTSNGETYDMEKMTAAHKRLPFDTWVNVKNLTNGQSTEVRINDRGPFVGKRIIDLSRAAAREIDMLGSGTARVRLTVIRPPGRQRRASSRPERTPRPARKAPQPQGGRFDIQAGVFSQRANADTLAQKVRRLGHQASVQAYSSGGTQRYRVLVTGGTRAQANSKLAALQGAGIEGFVRPRD